MHLFRRRYIVLGFLILVIYIQSVSPRSCGSRFQDLASNAARASRVIEGRALSYRKLKDTRQGDTLYSVTFNVTNVLGWKNSRRDRKSSPIRENKQIEVGMFSNKVDDVKCIGDIQLIERNPISRTSYIVFLGEAKLKLPRKHRSRRIFAISSYPVESTIKTNLELQKIFKAKKPGRPSVKMVAPSLSYNKFPDVILVERNSDIKIECRSRKPTLETIVEWYKDGVLLKNSSNIRLNVTSQGVDLLLKNFSDAYAGIYNCSAYNALGRSKYASVGIDEDEYDSFADKCSENKCLNDGTCRHLKKLGVDFCKCKNNYGDTRCQEKLIPNSYEYRRVKRSHHKRSKAEPIVELRNGTIAKPRDQTVGEPTERRRFN